MKKPEVSFDLTEDQMKILQPLFNKARVADDDNKPGMVILHAWESGVVDAGFVGYKNSKMIKELTEAI